MTQSLKLLSLKPQQQILLETNQFFILKCISLHDWKNISGLWYLEY